MYETSLFLFNSWVLARSKKTIYTVVFNGDCSLVVNDTV